MTGFFLIKNLELGIKNYRYALESWDYMIKLSQIVKTYDSPSGKVHALKGIDLNIAKGEIYGIIGLSGAGKSTLVRCINMLERPTSGNVIVDGDARKNIGMIFQHFNLLSSATVYDNIAFPLKLSNTSSADIAKKVEPLLELVGLKDKAKQYPSQLSGGQKQRVGIARALASDPKILLCDEATSALDPQTTKSILALIKDINKKFALTVVVITHEMQVIKEICDKVAVISDGIIAEKGSVLDVFTNPQHEITKEFISVLLSNDLPAAFRGNKISAEKVEDALLLLRLNFLGEKADDPVLAQMIRTCEGVECTMLFGNLDEIHGVPFGRFIVGLSGSESSIQNALNFLSSKDVRVEVIGYVRRNSSVAD